MTQAKEANIKLDIPARANIRNIVETHSAVLASLLEAEAVEIDLSDCNDVDLSFLQMVESARVYAKSAGKTVKLASPADGAVLETLKRAGFLDEITPEDAKFWLHREGL
ncbi:STAS domain-containing protein [Rhizobium sp. LjRoot30]|uniref:STAS domain-containing protein n=1 Tax=Rhizobium sp. LjRoot30 TaxID=3342320 RepID=UPI003ECDB4E8